jgi:osmotically-inducible protein OsmY
MGLSPRAASPREDPARPPAACQFAAANEPALARHKLAVHGEFLGAGEFFRRASEFRARLILQIERSLWTGEVTSPLALELRTVSTVHKRPEIGMEEAMTDMELKRHVEDALSWEPSIDAAEIGVSINDGVVTLRGDVGTYSEKSIAERVSLAVYGVKAVANDLEVRLMKAFVRTDTDIAQAAATALEWNTVVPSKRVTVSVSDGWVTLKGTLDWNYQKDAAFRAVRDLAGVRGVTNLITVQPRVKTADVRDKIEAAFKRSAEIDARRINVTATEGKVILSGNVHSWAERKEAERAAWAAPGVTQVDDRLAITP